jgi:hypothetical protein
LTHAEPLVRVFALGKLNRVLRNYDKSKLSKLDIRFLKGFYIQNHDELHADHIKSV